MNAESFQMADAGETDDTRPIELILGGRHSPHPSLGVVAPASQNSPRAYLLSDDGGILAEVPCSPMASPVVLGRGKTADIAIDDPYVHRHQAELRWDPETSCHFITHGGGANPTYVNRQRVHLPMRLIGGEHLRVGKTSLIYRIRR